MNVAEINTVTPIPSEDDQLSARKRHHRVGSPGLGSVFQLGEGTPRGPSAIENVNGGADLAVLSATENDDVSPGNHVRGVLKESASNPVRKRGPHRSPPLAQVQQMGILPQRNVSGVCVEPRLRELR